jgi:hypothetical protein
MFATSRPTGALTLALAGLFAFATATAVADEWALPTSPEESMPPPVLEVTARAHYEPAVPGEPGRTALDIKANFLWRVTVTVSAHGATVPVYESESSDVMVEEGGELTIGPTAMSEATVSWSCKQPGTVYSYVVTSEFGKEPPLTKTGSFTGASRGQCEKARRLSVWQHREEVREQRAEERRRLDEELSRDRLYEANCRKVGGKTVTIQTNEGQEIVCRSQTGGIVEA